MKPNGLITEPGIYDLTLPAYHSQCCAGPSTSASRLIKLRKKTPAHFWAYSDLNPLGRPEPRTAEMDFGKAAHALLLEGDLPAEQFAIQPFDGPYNRNEEVDNIEWKAGAKQAWKKEQETAGLVVVSPAHLQQIREMRDALAAHPMIRDGLFQGAVERSVIARDEETGIWLKARPDVVPVDTILADAKFVDDASPQSADGMIMRYGYHIQLALAADVIQAVTGREIQNACLVLQEKTFPYVVQVYPLSDHLMLTGRLEYKAALRLLKKCLDTNDWPGYPERTLTVPYKMQERLEREGLWQTPPQ